MQSLRDSVLRHLSVNVSKRQLRLPKVASPSISYHRQLCASVGSSHDQVKARVIGLVRKFDKIDAAKNPVELE